MPPLMKLLKSLEILREVLRDLKLEMTDAKLVLSDEAFCELIDSRTKDGMRPEFSGHGIAVEPMNKKV